MIEVLKRYEVKNKSIVQFCSNNGRELLAVVKNGAKSGVGFDIAENQVNYANDLSHTLGLPCNFYARNILDIGKEFVV